VASSETKSLTFRLREEKGSEKEGPAVLKAVLKSDGAPVAEAAPLTLIGPGAMPTPTPTVKP
jgi:hypothetical protein